MNHETPEQTALRLLGEHCAGCRTCMTVDSTGTNSNLPCDEGDRLANEMRQARRGAPVLLGHPGQRRVSTHGR